MVRGEVLMGGAWLTRDLVARSPEAGSPAQTARALGRGRPQPAWDGDPCN